MLINIYDSCISLIKTQLRLKVSNTHNNNLEWLFIAFAKQNLSQNIYMLIKVQAATMVLKKYTFIEKIIIKLWLHLCKAQHLLFTLGV